MREPTAYKIDINSYMNIEWWDSYWIGSIQMIQALFEPENIPENL